MAVQPFVGSIVVEKVGWACSRRMFVDEAFRRHSSGRVGAILEALLCGFCFIWTKDTGEISHVPVRLLPRRDAKTIQRHLQHAC